MNAKDLARQWFEEVWNQKRRATIESMMAEQIAGDAEGGLIGTRQAFLDQHFAVFLAAFPDLHVEIEGIIAETDEAAIRWFATGTHRGPLADLPSSGRKVRFSGMTWMQFRDGRVVAAWDRWNVHGLLELLRSGAESHTARLTP